MINLSDFTKEVDEILNNENMEGEWNADYPPGNPV